MNCTYNCYWLRQHLVTKLMAFHLSPKKAGSNTAQPRSRARWPAAWGEASLLIWLLQSSGWRRAAQDSWSHKRGDNSSQLGKLPTPLQKHFLIRSANQKWAEWTLRERGDCGSSEGPNHSLVCWETLEVGYAQSNFSSPREMKFLSTQAKYTILCK